MKWICDRCGDELEFTYKPDFQPIHYGHCKGFYKLDEKLIHEIEWDMTPEERDQHLKVLWYTIEALGDEKRRIDAQLDALLGQSWRVEYQLNKAIEERDKLIGEN